MNTASQDSQWITFTPACSMERVSAYGTIALATFLTIRHLVICCCRFTLVLHRSSAGASIRHVGEADLGCNFRSVTPHRFQCIRSYGPHRQRELQSDYLASEDWRTKVRSNRG